MKDLDKLSPELSRFAKYMPTGKDPTLLVLRTHLLVETEMNEFIERQIPNHGALKKARFTFLQKLRIIEALSTNEEFLYLTSAIEALNELRNALAHKLDVPHFETLAQEVSARSLYAVYDKATRSRLKAPVVEKYSLESLRTSAAILVGRLSYYKQVGAA